MDHKIDLCNKLVPLPPLGGGWSPIQRAVTDNTYLEPRGSAAGLIYSLYKDIVTLLFYIEDFI